MSQCRIRPEALDAYFHGMLNEAQHRELSAHLLTCAACNKAVAALEAEAYTVGKGLRDISVPPMSVAARDLVARYAGTRTPDATTIEFDPSETGCRTEGVLTRLPSVKDVPPARRSFIIRTAAGAWSLARRHSLGRVASIAFITGVAIWLVITTVKRIEILTRTEAQHSAEIARLIDSQRQQENAAEQREKDHGKALIELQNKMAESSVREWTRQKLLIMEDQENIRTALADLQTRLDALGSKLDARDANAAQIRDALEKERVHLQEILRTQQKEVVELTQRIQDHKPDLLAQDPDALRLMPSTDGEDTVTWEELKGAPSIISCKGAPIGWSVSLNHVRGEDSTDPGERVITNNTDVPHVSGLAAGNGRIFVGNGWNDNSLLALDGATGQVRWTFPAETGVGSPVISEDNRTVYFASRTGTVTALTVGPGNRTFKWAVKFNDPILTQPAVDGRHIYVVHSSKNSKPGFGDKNFPYSITCLTEESGNVVNVAWNRGLSADAITSPVIDANNHIHVATTDGTLYIIDSKGKEVWTYAGKSTSAPMVAGNWIYFSSWDASSQDSFEESLNRLSTDGFGKGTDRLVGPFPAQYFLPKMATPSLSVGSMGAGDPSRDEKVTALNAPATPMFRNAWSYLGARPTVIDQTAYAMVGDHLVSVDLRRGNVNWSRKVVGQSEVASTSGASSSGIGQGQPCVTPPSYANGKLYVGSAWGDLLCINAEKGDIAWRYRLPESQGVTSQVILDHGMAYATTAKGNIICINTNDPAATGWSAWGGSASHNGPSNKH